MNLEPLAILISTVVGSALGAAWYAPALLGEAWMAELGKTAEQLGPKGPAIGGSVASCLIAAVSVDFLVGATGSGGVLAGAGIGAVVGLGILAMAMLSDSLFSGWGFRLYFIQMGYRATYLVLMGAISGAFRAGSSG